jgi:membrane fusion protein, multidrug efflux system
MLRRFRPLLSVFPCGLVLLAASGCETNRATVAPRELPAVPIAHPVQREVTDYVEFTGRTEPIHSVDIRPRVTGYLMEMPFKEGTEVKAGDLLFVVDPRPYKAQLDQAQGQVDLYMASLKLARVTLARDLAVNIRQPQSISQQVIDQDRAVVEEAEARVEAFKKSMEIYQLSHEFTNVTSPIDGQISRYYLTLGNLVNQDQTLLTTIVSQDPMYAYFEMDEPTLLRTRRAINEGKIKQPREGEIPVLMGLQGEEGFPHKGTINFVNNQVNPTTGSILVRGVFANPRPEGGTRLLSPGMFVRIRLPIGLPHPALLVIDRAIGSDQGIKFVYVIDAEDKVQTRRITTGALQEDGLRVIETGIQPDDWMVVGGLQQVRPRVQARPEKIAMPTLAPNVTGEDTNPPAAPPKGAAPSADRRREATAPPPPAAPRKGAATTASGPAVKAVTPSTPDPLKSVSPSAPDPFQRVSPSVGARKAG